LYPAFDAINRNPNESGLTRSSTGGSLGSQAVNATGEGTEKREEKKTERRKEKRSQATLICFLGGVTYPELAALRFLRDKNLLGLKSETSDLLFATTSLINGKNMIEQLIDPHMGVNLKLK